MDQLGHGVLAAGAHKHRRLFRQAFETSLLEHAPNRACYVRLECRARDHQFVVSMLDDAGLQENWGAGVGLANIRSRLATAYGVRARLLLAHGPDGGVTATIEIPLEAHEQARAA